MDPKKLEIIDGEIVYNCHGHSGEIFIDVEDVDSIIDRLIDLRNLVLDGKQNCSSVTP